MAQFGTTAADLNAVLKMLYPDGLPLDSAYKTSRLLGMLKKRELKGAGLGTKIPVQIANVGSVSATFADAVGTNQTAQVYKAFEVEIVPFFAGAGITGLAMAKAKGSEAAFVEAVKSTMDSALYAMGRANSAAIYGDGTGVVGTTTAIVSGQVITISRREARNFEVGQRISIYAPDLVTQRDSTGTTPVSISAINRHATATTATLTILGSGNVAAVASGDKIVRAGNLNGLMYGLQTWVPPTLALVTALGGVTRTVDVERLAGLRGDLSGGSEIVAATTALAQMSESGAMTSHLMVSPTTFQAIATSLGSTDQRERMTVKSFDGRHGYSAIKMVGGGSGEVDLVMDPDCPDDRLFALELDTWEIVYAGGGFPHIDEDDGNKTLRSATADGIDFRVKQYAQLLCHAPARNGTFVI